MSANRRRQFRNTISVAVACLFLLQITASCAGAYDLGTVVADMRQAASASGGTSCPQRTRFDISTPGSINRHGAHRSARAPLRFSRQPRPRREGQTKYRRSSKRRSRCGRMSPARCLRRQLLARCGKHRRQRHARHPTDSMPFASIRMTPDSLLAFWRSRASFRRTRWANGYLQPPRLPHLSARSWTRTSCCCPEMPAQRSRLPRRSRRPERLRPPIHPHTRTRTLLRLQPFGRVGRNDVSLRSFAGPDDGHEAHGAVSRCAALRRRPHGTASLYPDPSDSSHIGTISGRVCQRIPSPCPFLPPE